jgi:hypothetical protein
MRAVGNCKTRLDRVFRADPSDVSSRHRSRSEEIDMQQLEHSNWNAISGGSRAADPTQGVVARWQWVDPQDPVQFSNPWAAVVESRPTAA